MKKFIAIAVLMLGMGFAHAKNKPTNPQDSMCKAYFTIAEQDDNTSSLQMFGFDEKQSKWYGKDGGKYPEVCFLGPDQRTSKNELDNVLSVEPKQGALVYVIGWEEHRVFVPDRKGGHYAWSANGILYLYDGESMKALGPVHSTNRTIFSSSAVSLLKSGLEEIQHRIK